MTVDFTIEKYEELCLVLLENDYHPVTFSAYLEDNIDNKRLVILRHDIDRKPSNASRMAELENRLGIRATYYFRYPYTFDREIIKEISCLGHEVGYHYEVLSKSKGDLEKAITEFEQELNEFRASFDVKTICMHGSPLSKFDNRDLWNYHDFRDYNLIGEAYLTIGPNIRYYSDTGRCWNQRNKVRDHIPNRIGADNLSSIHDTDDLINLVKLREMEELYINVHPERWTSNYLEWIISYLKDIIFNIVKQFS